MSSEFRFCPMCGTALTSSDARGRQRCTACHWIRYRNPTVGVAVVVRKGTEILLGQRRSGRWCIPCGHVEYDESIQQAAVREFAEETGLVVELGPVLAVHSNFHNPEHQTVGIWYAGTPVEGDLRSGDDLEAVSYFPLDSAPELEFPTDRQVIEDLARSENQAAKRG